MTLRIALRGAFAFLLFCGAAGAAYFLVTEDLVSAFRGLAYKLLAFNVAALGVLVMEILYDWKHRIDPNAGRALAGPDLARLWGFRVLALCILAGLVFGGV
jgi:hypothetical protein